MDKLKLHSPNLTQENMARIRDLFPNCVTEARDEDGKVKLAVDFDLLRQELSESIVEGPQERYRLDWPGKREALLAANAPIAKTLRPCREESVDFDTTKNLYIEGDNLDALKLLQETYLGKVKMIYIDPPYNTGSDFIYEDDFAENTDEFLRRSNQKDEEGNRLVANTESNGRFHSDWLSMMYPRLKLAKNLLRDDGVIFISCDDCEQANVKRLCDEVFGEDNFLVSIIWQKRITPENRRAFSHEHDYIICYTKNSTKYSEDVHLLPLTQEAINRYKNPDNDPRGVWQSVPAIAQAGHGTKSQFYKLKTPDGRLLDPPNGCCWRYSEEKMNKSILENRIWFGVDGKGVPRIKKFMDETKQGLTPSTIWYAADVGANEHAKKNLKTILDGHVVFDSPKPIGLTKKMMQLVTLPCNNELVFDFFSGSATTAHAVMQLNAEDGGNRQFIMVQLPEPCDEKSEAYKAGYTTIAEIGKERMRRAGAKIKAELAAQNRQNAQGSLLDANAQSTTQLDTGFRVLKVDSSNMADVYYTPDTLNQSMLDMMTDNIKLGRTPEDLLFQVLLDWGVDLTLPIREESIQGKTVFFVDANALVACFDTGLTEELLKELTRVKPLRVVFRDTGFASDAVKINATQIFRQLSPGTEVKTI